MAKQSEGRQQRKARRAVERNKASTIRPPTQNDVNAKSANGKRAEEYPGHSAPIPTFLPQLSLHSDPPLANSRNTQMEKKTTKHWFKDAVEVIGIIFGIVGVFFLILQYREMVRATKATLEAVEVSRKQAATMEHQLNFSERAWIGVSSVSVAGYSPQHVGFRFDLKNTGHTPCKVSTVDVEVFITDSTSSKNRSTNMLYRRHDESGMWVSPTDAFPLVLNERHPAIEESVFATIQSEAREVHFHFAIAYTDIFGKARHTDSCAILTGPPEFLNGGGAIKRCQYSRMD